MEYIVTCHQFGVKSPTFTGEAVRGPGVDIVHCRGLAYALIKPYYRPN